MQNLALFLDELGDYLAEKYGDDYALVDIEVKPLDESGRFTAAGVIAHTTENHQLIVGYVSPERKVAAPA